MTTASFRHRFRAVCHILMWTVVLWPGPRLMAHSHAEFAQGDWEVVEINRHLCRYHGSIDSQLAASCWHFHWVFPEEGPLEGDHESVGETEVGLLGTTWEGIHIDGCDSWLSIDWVFPTESSVEPTPRRQSSNLNFSSSLASSGQTRLTWFCIWNC